MVERTARMLVGWLVASLACFALAPVEAKAIGEIFRIDTTGTEYCGDFEATKFGGRTAVPLWVRLDSGTQITVSLTPNFAPGTTFPMLGFFYLTKNGAELVAGVLFEDGAYATIQGNARFDRRSGLVTQLSGMFIQNSVLSAGCFSSGKFKSARQPN